ncbi:MFS transporter [Pseudonocardia spinosispora]|uniref:MFS transporter n=1 Tax=Pseudonocardia spinosispora TaxID=103441 RepID=UPI00041436E4|nr:MFS transporter [Pseudonocardia spinosispora]
MDALARARNGVLAAFAANGLCFASWLSRAPQARDALSLSAAQLGLLLLCLSGGACLALPASGPAVHRWGAARVVLIGSILVGLGLLGFAAGLAAGTVWPAAVGLVLTGIGMSNWDVAMNVAGADVERRRGRSLMPRLHAGFSLGTVAGGGVGALLAAWLVPLAIQVAVVAVLAPVAMAFAVRLFLPEEAHEPDQPRPKGDALRAWREPRTLLIGLLTLCAAFAEGSANDWLAVALVDGHQTSAVVGALGFGVFVTAMTIGRLAGGALLDRFGRVVVLRGLLAVALVGLLLVAFASSIVWVLVGATLWGFGASLGFPVGMSAASDEPKLAAARVGVVSSVAYTAFLAGPPLIGLLAEHSGILHALLVVLGALVVALLVTGVARPPAAPEAR